MVKIQVDDVDEMFTEIDLIRQNGWREIKIPVSSIAHPRGYKLFSCSTKLSTKFIMLIKP